MVVEGIAISLTEIDNEDYICLTDMVKAKDGDFFIADWLRRISTLEYIAAWEQLYNPKFKVVDFDHFRNEAGSNAFVLSVKEWVAKTGAIGIRAQAGRYGGTYAHKDIAFGNYIPSNLSG